MIFSKNKIEKSLPHFVGLLLFSILPLFVFESNNDRDLFWMYSYYYQLVFMIVAFYINYLVITPRFFFAKSKWQFFGVILLFGIVLLIISQYTYDLIQFDSLRPENILRRNNTPRQRTFGLHPKLADNFFLMLLVIGFSSGIAIIQQLRKNEAKQKEIEKANVDSELAFLKNQISPHFFFNSLNSIYALIAIDSDKAQKAVEKLSVLMRYLIYDSDVEAVELQNEFDFTRNYIELMQHRLSSKIELKVEINTQLPHIKMPPLLFIPFVENAFKHGISYRDHSFISITLKVADDKVVFECRNSIPTRREASNEKGGVGIVNIKKRLELIYGKLAQLVISNTNNIYLVQLTVPLEIDPHE